MDAELEFPKQLIDALRSAQQVVVLTGAGVSKESGIPTFREAQTGLWANYNPEDLATPEAFQRDPKLVWEWYTWRRGLVSEASPNPGHYAIVEIARRVPGFSLITQNVDGLHQRAGSDAVLELHGNIMRTKCFEENVLVESWQDNEGIPPKCPRCGGFLRPDVVWFGEGLPEGVLDQAVEAAVGADVFLSVGTSSVVQPAASLPLYARQAGALVVEINPESTPLSQLAEMVIPHPSGEALPALVQQVWGSEKKRSYQ
ncbi:MAG: NAD-dependent deacylase [Chloroflexota bacterium]